MAAEFIGGNAVLLAECTVKGTQAVKAGIKGNIRHRLAGGLQHDLGESGPAAVEIIPEGDMELLRENPGQEKFADAQLLGHLLQGQRLHKVNVHIRKNRLDKVEILDDFHPLQGH
ncbi:hypothetical protein D3C75_1150360 [compost metagenome]